MFLSKASEYAVKAIIYIASQSMRNKRTNLTDIANAISSPPAYTAKILQSLVKGKLIQSTRGASGGFEMDSQRIEDTNLMDVVTCIDGTSDFTSCVLGLSKCSSSNPCPLHFQYFMLKENTMNLLNKSKIKDMAIELDLNNTVLIN